MKTPIKFILILLLLSYILLFGYAFTATFVVPLNAGYLGNQIAPDAPYLAWIWANFDGRHYLEIAIHGYQGNNFAFFPLYSLLIVLLDYILPINHLYIGLLLSAVFSFLSMVMIYKIISLDYQEHIARYALIAFAFFPLAFFSYAVYTDSLFLFLTTSCFYFARKRYWFWAGIFAGLGFVDRFSAIALLPALAVEWYLQYGKRYINWRQRIISFYNTALVAILLGVLGFLSYLLYLQLFHGNFMLFQQSRSAWDPDKFVFPLQTVYRYLKIFWLVDYHLLQYWVAVLEFVSIIIYFVISFYVTLKIRASYGIYMIVLLSIIPAIGSFAGNPRYALHMFPVFLVLGLMLNNSKRFRVFYAVLFLVLGFILTALFTRGYFIT